MTHDEQRDAIVEAGTEELEQWMADAEARAADGGAKAVSDAESTVASIEAGLAEDRQHYSNQLMAYAAVAGLTCDDEPEPPEPPEPGEEIPEPPPPDGEPGVPERLFARGLRDSQGRPGELGRCYGVATRWDPQGGRLLVYVASETRGVILFEFDPEAPAMLSFVQGGAPESAFRLAMSPDKKWLYSTGNVSLGGQHGYWLYQYAIRENGVLERTGEALVRSGGWSAGNTDRVTASDDYVTVPVGAEGCAIFDAQTLALVGQMPNFDSAGRTAIVYNVRPESDRSFVVATNLELQRVTLSGGQFSLVSAQEMSRYRPNETIPYGESRMLVGVAFNSARVHHESSLEVDTYASPEVSYAGSWAMDYEPETGLVACVTSGVQRFEPVQEYRAQMIVVDPRQVTGRTYPAVSGQAGEWYRTGATGSKQVAIWHGYVFAADMQDGVSVWRGLTG